MDRRGASSPASLQRGFRDLRFRKTVGSWRSDAGTRTRMRCCCAVFLVKQTKPTIESRSTERVLETKWRRTVTRRLKTESRIGLRGSTPSKIDYRAAPPGFGVAGTLALARAK